MNARPPSDTSASRGFVLPYVLATIAILSLIAVLGANTLRDAQLNLRRLQQHDLVRQAIEDAEAIVTDAFLASTLTPDALYLGERANVSQLDIELGLVEEEALDDQLRWSASGGAKRIEIDGVQVRVEYQDAGSLVSLYSADPSLIAQLIEAQGEKRSEGQALAAKLADFMDVDNARRFTGGERADYRLARLRPPTNSPVRSWEELGSVMGWDDLPFYRDRSFLKYITFFLGASSPRASGMPPALTALLEEDARRVRVDHDPLVDETMVGSKYPTHLARFTFLALSPDGTFGLRRIIEAERTAGAPDFAVSRRLIADQLIAPEDIETLDLDALPALAVPPPGRARQ